MNEQQVTMQGGGYPGWMTTDTLLTETLLTGRGLALGGALSCPEQVGSEEDAEDAETGSKWDRQIAPYRKYYPAISPIISPYNLNLPVLHCQKIYLCNQLICMIVTSVFEIEGAALISKARLGHKAAFARHLAMYLCYVTGFQSQQSVADFFGRHRTTISYACGVIEDYREDALFDEEVCAVEIIVMALQDSLSMREVIWGGSDTNV